MTSYEQIRMRALELAVQSMPAHSHDTYVVLALARAYEAYVKTGLIAGDPPDEAAKAPNGDHGYCMERQ